MQLIPIDPSNPDPEVIAHAAAVVRRGGLVAFPTETVYGLGAYALDRAAVQRIYEAKKRPGFNPLIVHLADAEQAADVVREWPREASALAERFWPGPLTLVLPKLAVVPDVITAGLDSVAVRVPAHPVALALLRAANVPIAAPSANRYTRVSPTTAGHVARSLGDRVDLILDGGPTNVGIESTVVDLSGSQPTVLRPGVIDVSALESVLGRDVAIAPLAGRGSAPRRSPGMIERHYAPTATVRLFAPDESAAATRVLADATARGQATGAIVRTVFDLPATTVIRMPADPRGYARELYAALHALDDAGVSLAVIERPPDTPAWAGVRDRLERASA